MNTYYLDFVHDQQADRKVKIGPRCEEEKAGRNSEDCEAISVERAAYSFLSLICSMYEYVSQEAMTPAASCEAK